MRVLIIPNFFTVELLTKAISNLNGRDAIKYFLWSFSPKKKLKRKIVDEKMSFFFFSLLWAKEAGARIATTDDPMVTWCKCRLQSVANEIRLVSAQRPTRADQVLPLLDWSSWQNNKSELLFFACSHRPKTKELLELFLFLLFLFLLSFTIWFISSLKKIKWIKLPNWELNQVFQIHSQALIHWATEP